MTNKEKIEALKRQLILHPSYLTIIEEIEKDLEVLEILKKHYLGDGWSNGGVIEFWEMNGKELKKVKEWLNEK